MTHNARIIFSYKKIASRGIYETVEPTYRDFRVGDVRHSQADINKAKEGLGYNPEFTILEGIDKYADI